MPELPEVETVRRSLAPELENRKITRAVVRRRDMRVRAPENFESLVSGAAVRGTTRRGKYILIELSNERMLVVHLGMSGRLKIVPASTDYLEEKHDHLALELSGGAKMIMNDPRRFGSFQLLRRENWTQEKPFAAMGPEPLGADFTGVVLLERLAGRARNIKSALLDQNIVAGVGNIYACEALFKAGIHPARAAGDLNRAEADRLARALREIMEEAIACGGTTLKDHKLPDGERGRYGEKLSVYAKEGELCVNKCGGEIQRFVQSQRASYYCPRCQRER